MCDNMKTIVSSPVNALPVSPIPTIDTSEQAPSKIAKLKITKIMPTNPVETKLEIHPPKTQQPTDLIRVGQRKMRKSYPSSTGFLQIPAWSGGKGIYSQLSPFYLGPIKYDGINVLTFENLWQFSKIYKTQVDTNGNPTQDWYDWRNKGFISPAERHPMGKEVPLYSYFNGEKIGVVEARKKIYIPYYKELARKTPAYKELLTRLKAGQPLLLIEPDGPSLQDFPEGMQFSRELFWKLIDVTDQKTFFSLVGLPYPYPGNRYYPLGHGYVLADALLEDLEVVK